MPFLRDDVGLASEVAVELLVKLFVEKRQRDYDKKRDNNSKDKIFPFWFYIHLLNFLFRLGGRVFFCHLDRAK